MFLLREGFDCEFSDIARIVEKSEENCRQILARARKHIEERRPRYDVSPADADSLIAPFLKAVREGDLETMLARLSQNVVLVADGGDKAGASLRPLQGAEKVARAMIAATRKQDVVASELHLARINGLPGVVRFQDGHARAVLAFGIVGGQIQSVFVISNPDKLRHIQLPGTAAPTPPNAHAAGNRGDAGESSASGNAFE